MRYFSFSVYWNTMNANESEIWLKSWLISINYHSIRGELCCSAFRKFNFCHQEWLELLRVICLPIGCQKRRKISSSSLSFWHWFFFHGWLCTALTSSFPSSSSSFPILLCAHFFGSSLLLIRSLLSARAHSPWIIKMPFIIIEVCQRGTEERRDKEANVKFLSLFYFSPFRMMGISIGK